MRIGIVGAGAIGGTVGALWATAGHVVRFGTRNPGSVRPLLARLGAGAEAGSPADAAAFGEVVLCAAPYGAWPELAAAIGPHVSGKVVLDAANPYPARDGDFARAAIAAGRGAGRPVAALLPAARLVRAFSTVYAGTLAREAHRAGDRVGIPLAGDDPAALREAADLVRDAGFEPVVVGGLDRARDFDPGSAVYNTGMSGPEVARALGIAPPLRPDASDL
jgi:hypothetical protein